MNVFTIVPGVILAGGHAKPDLAAAAGTDKRGLIPVGDSVMWKLIAEQLSSGGVAPITVVGDIGDVWPHDSVSDQGDFVSNLLAGLRSHPKADFVLVCTADVPFLTPESIHDFVEQSSRLNVDIVYPIVAVKNCYDKFPGLKRTALRIQEGDFTGGNMMLIRSAALLSHPNHIRRAYGARKSPLRLAFMLGLGTVGRLILSLMGFRNVLRLSVLERAAGKLLKCTARAYESPYAELATDVDRPSDLEAMRKILSRKTEVPP